MTIDTAVSQIRSAFLTREALACGRRIDLLKKELSTVIRARGVGKVYREGATELRALEEVDLEVRAGELTLLMGPSGSGKTTLLSILGCILRASAGKLEVLGKDVSLLAESELPRIRREGIGFVFQGFNLFPALTAAENVALALDVRGVRPREAKKRGEELLAEVGLAQKARSFPADLSGGQKQRVAIARALAGDPPILLADEPTAALDSTSGRTVIELLQRLARVHGRAVVMVTHDPRVLPFGDRIIHLEDGRIVREEKTGAVETSAFLEVQPGTPAMAQELSI
jgi:putative ABC transport system ATP-binding protein